MCYWFPNWGVLGACSVTELGTLNFTVKHFQLDGKGNTKAKTLKPTCHFHKKTHFIIINKNKMLFFLILHICTDGLLLQWLSGASWGPCPSAGKTPSWAFLLTDGDRTLLRFTLETLFIACQTETDVLQHKNIQIFKGYKTINSSQQRAFCNT